jgi:membrane protease YdiL (CAAX protease family)
MKKIFGVNLYFLILVLLQIFGGYLLKPFVYLFNGKIWFILLATQILFLIVPLVIYLIVTKKSVVSTLRLKKIRLKNLPSIIGVALLIYPIAGFLGLVTDLFFHNNVGDVLSKMSSLPLWAFVLIIALTPAICEEMTMRGIVLSGYNKMGINGAAVITGLLFAVLHMNPPQFLYTFALGIIFAYLVRITDSIFSSIICHFIFNGISACASWFQLKHGVKNTDITSLSPMVRNSMLVTLFVFTVGAVVGIVFIILYLKKINTENEIMDVSVTQGDIVIENDKTVYKIIAYLPIAISVVLYIAYVLYVGKIIS